MLPRERRLAAAASIALFFVLFLPWYQETVVVPGAKSASAATASVTGWGHFSFVEAAVLLVSASVLMLLFQRAEGRAFHIPGGDGGVIFAGGVWTCLLVAWQMFDKPSASIHGGGASISGIEWGIFAALAAAGLLAYSGSRIRSAHRPEPPLPGETRPPSGPGIVLASPDEPGRIEATEATVPVRSAPVIPAPVRAGDAGDDAAARSSRSAPPQDAPPRDSPPQDAPPRDSPAQDAPPRDTPPRDAPAPVPPGHRPRGWLSAPPRHKRDDGEQLTMPLDRDE